jgi:hypothetical protein
MMQTLESVVFDLSGGIRSHKRYTFDKTRWFDPDASFEAARECEFVCSAPARLVTQQSTDRTVLEATSVGRIAIVTA